MCGGAGGGLDGGDGKLHIMIIKMTFRRGLVRFESNISTF
jgi:hypothetical protein